MVSAVFMAVSVGTIIVLNKEIDSLQVSSTPKFVRNSAVLSSLIWALVLMKSAFAWLSSSSESHERVKSTHSRNKYLVFVATVLTFFKGYSDVKSTGSTLRLQMSKPDALDDAFNYVKHSKAWNATNEYGEYAFEWTKNKTSTWYDQAYNSTSEWVKSKVNTTKIGDYKDQMLEEFDEWVAHNVDIEKYANMSKAAKKALWKEFLEELD